MQVTEKELNEANAECEALFGIILLQMVFGIKLVTKLYN
jgi:hypothetical protein